MINYDKNKKYIILDNEFHKYLFEIAGLTAFWDILTNSTFDFDRLRHLSASNVKRSRESTKEHLNIYLAIKNNKIGNLKKAIKKHFNNSKKYYKELKKKNPSLIE